MTVQEMVFDMQLDQKYAVEVEFYSITEEGEIPLGYDTLHFIVGHGGKNPYFHEKVQNIRCVADEIYLRVYVERSTE